ncbi:MAG: bifunctional phosphoribosylaminoimidazolecarboxamide formyltransferase/IMP cyclohydrolase [Candidatus Omnitrophica bacterium]|nr:bifunctional phosphoribosylaminoimidazolecarboxamide formyltransferase/IMP cyclohydrolase [Candidatus Omnitrophota bacterium]
MKIRRALISVSEKEGLIPFARGLRRLGAEILSTGGTAKLLRGQGIPVKEIADFTGFPEILSGRVKTLHPKVHGGILADRGNPEHRAQTKRLGISPIDLVVVNLYPFEAAAKKKNAALSELIEQIDIGGVALIRSAAKNFQSVGVVCRPAQYSSVLEEMERGKGALSEPTRRRLAQEAFSETAYYDSVIHQALAHRFSPKGKAKRLEWPQRMVLGALQRQPLRYGENPHQTGAWYQWPEVDGGLSGLASARQLHGKKLSFNNLLDLDAALQMVAAFRRPTAVFVKHNNPCGIAAADSIAQAIGRAYACDPLSSFGGILGLNRPMDRKTAQAVLACGFLECVVAPGVRPDALRLLEAKKNLRILELPAAEFKTGRRCLDLKQIGGGLLVQEPDTFRRGPARWRAVTRKKPTEAQKKDLFFAWTVARFVRSNAIVLAHEEQTVGIGVGQSSRVDSVRFALKKAGPRAQGAVLASDGFFPKPDGPQAAIRGGIRAIVQPGGSVQDPAVIEVADRAGIPMLMTGERHFKH